ncbi:IS66 family transposase [Anaeromyxobacter oryzisoli]|uniref:IS66 family transposase n=1 Tax=Anaeromyxobacter oryzisoli TaxID=2925408 RepID=UPI001F59D359|nr:IS66 family transposase [Anaeromyxobacter sp. SG63]
MALRLGEEKDIEIVRQAALILERENKRLVDRNVELTRRLLTAEGRDPAELQLEIARLEAQLAGARKKLFGTSSEKRPSSSRTSPEKQDSQTGHGPREQKELAIVEQIHELDEADRACPACGGALTEMAGQYEESEEIDVVERRFVLKKHKRKKYRCACGGCVETALGPLKLMAGGRYSIDFAIAVAIQKYLDHLPLERQARIMAREGLTVDSQTLWDQIERLARVLGSAHESLHAYVLTQAVLGADETRWRMLDGKGRDAGVSKNWQVWVLAAPDAVVYRIEDSRSTDAAKNVLGGFAGIAMADGYGAYEALAKRGDGFVVAHCWAHVRRKFVEAEPFFAEATTAVDLIGELYAVEKLCPTGPPGDELRRQLRNERSREAVRRLQRWALEAPALPQSALGKAIAYMGGVWNGLVRFLEDPRIPIDNNASERALRGVVVGRKNHYGSKSRRGTEVAAVFYSLVESAKLVGVDPHAYLRAASHAGLRGERIPLPHEMAARG